MVPVLRNGVRQVGAPDPRAACSSAPAPHRPPAGPLGKPRLGPPPSRNSAQSQNSGGAGKIIFTVVLFVAAIAVAFLVGQSTRPSAAEVDRNTNQAVKTARESAAASYGRAFNQLQAKAAAALAVAQKKAREQGLAEGQAAAQQSQQESKSIFDKVTGCVLSGNC